MIKKSVRKFNSNMCVVVNNYKARSVSILATTSSWIGLRKKLEDDSNLKRKSLKRYTRTTFIINKIQELGKHKKNSS